MKITPFVLIPVAASLESSAENLLAAVGHRNVTQMESLIQGLADESVKEPHLKMDKDIQDALKAIRTMFVKSIQDSLVEQHKADQVAHNCGVKSCFEKCQKNFQDENGQCEDSVKKCNIIRDEHVKCRTNVHTLYKDMAIKCGKLHCFDVPDVKCKYEKCLCKDLLNCHTGKPTDPNDAYSPIVCEAVSGNCKSDPKDGYGAWLQETITKYEQAWATWSTLYKECSDAYKKFLKTDYDCDGKQKEFEMCMCKKQFWGSTICAVDYNQCNEKCWQWYENDVPNLQCQEKDRKIDWASTKKIECYVDVLLHEYTKDELLKKCGSETCINVAREKDYKHCATICPEVDHCDEWPKCDAIAIGDGSYQLNIQTHTFRDFHDEYFLGDSKFECDMNGAGVFTEHRIHGKRQAENRCTEHLDIDFQIPPPPLPCPEVPEVCGPEWHCHYYHQFDDTSKIGCISDCCPDDGSRTGCFDEVDLMTCDGDKMDAFVVNVLAKKKKISFGEHTEAWAYNRCECEKCKATPPKYPAPGKFRGVCSGIHEYPGECSKHNNPYAVVDN